MDYFRERAKPALIGLLVGILIGWFQPLLLGAKIPDSSARIFMSLQMGMAFMMIGLFIASYLNIRRKVYTKYSKQPPKL